MGEVVDIKVKWVQVEYACETCRTEKYAKIREDEAKLLRWKPKACPDCGCVYFCTIIERLN